MTGHVIPEPCYDRASYQRVILDPLQTVVGDLDEDGVLEGEWLNARGAIARFDRSALEIRLIDTQECPRADVAVAWAVACVVGDLCRERWSSREEQGAFAVEPLHALLVEATRVGPEARVADRAYARALGWTGAAAPSLGELWDELLESSVARHPQTDGERLRPLRTIRRQGTLSHRIRGALGASPSRARTHEVYRELCECLREGRSFAEE